MYKLFSILKTLDEVPNVPFFTNKISETVIKICEDMEITKKDVVINKSFLGISLTIKIGEPTKRIVLCSHLDHPGFVFNNNGLGRPLGSVGGIGNLGLSEITKPTEMDFYSSDGEYIGKSKVHIEGNRISCEDLNLKRNTIGMWHLEDTSFLYPGIRMRSADNHVSTAVILYAVSKIMESLKDMELVLLFTSVEEIFQISMTGVCVEKCVAGKKISQDDVFIVLETMEIDPYEVSTIDYNGGPLIKVNDAEVPYGVGSEQKNNKAEAMLLKAASGLKHQHGLSSGHTDALALSLMTDCPNIATLAIPCQNKHNVTNLGVVTTENVNTEDVETSIEILKRLLKHGETEETGRLLSIKTAGDPKKLHDKKLERILKYKQNKPRLSLGFYYPENIFHWLLLAKSRFM
ncbi:MAG: hypothetical protein WAX66_01685 [Patescibacteria group bacterium]